MTLRDGFPTTFITVSDKGLADHNRRPGGTHSFIRKEKSMSGRLILVGFIAALIPLAAESAAQTSTNRATPEFLASLKAGQWIQLEGTPQRDYSVLCTELKVLTGDFIDDDWMLRGPVRNLNPKTREFSIMRYHVRLKDQVEYDDDGVGKFKGFSDLRPGQVVKLEGTYMKDGSFLAKEINDESAKQARKPGWERRIQISGKIESVNVGKRAITCMGSPFYIGDQTKLKSVIK
jgi:hypothetical protein